MMDAGFRRAQAVYEAQEPDWHEDSPADVARDIAADIRRDMASLRATHPDVLRLVRAVNNELFVPLLVDMVGPDELADCDTAADVADAIDAAALEWEEIVAEGDDYDDGDDW